MPGKRPRTRKPQQTQFHRSQIGRAQRFIRLHMDAPLTLDQVAHEQFTELLGVSGIDKTKQGEDSMIYQAGVCLAAKPAEVPKGLQYRALSGGKYAKFLLTGPYSHIWMAFSQIFRTLAESGVRLREDFCIENYVNDPKVTPEEQLQTEILIPIA